jgi:Flp pilus assembly protein TadD
VNALERAEALSTGFEEVHQYLAIAYWRAGYPSKARQQIAVLTELDPANPADPGFARLRKKISTPIKD